MEVTPFRGRETELQRLLVACRGSAEPGALVEGDAGSGKTRLVRAAASVWADDGRPVIWTSASQSSRQFAFGALIGVAPALDPTDFDAAVRRVLEVLEVLGPMDRPVLVVDDAHLLDDASAALLHHLVLRAAPVALVLVLQRDQGRPDAVGALGKDHLLQVLELGPLDQEHSALLFEDLVAGPVAPASARHLYDLSGGNPLFLHELVDAAREAGALARRGGIWTLRGDVPIAGRRLNQLVRRRLAGIGAQVQEVLDLLALAGPLPLDELIAIVGSASVAAAEASEAVVVETVPGQQTVRCVHPLYTEVLRSSMGQIRRAQALRALDTTLRAFPARAPADRLKRALIALESGEQHADDAEAFTEASRLARPDHELAERFARAALGAGGGFEAVDYLFDALMWQGRIDEARQLAADSGDDLTREERDYFSLRLARMVWWMTGERPPDTVEVAPPGPASSPAALATLARQVAMTAVAGRAFEVLDSALMVVDHPQSDDEARCWATAAAMLGLSGQGRVADALALTAPAYRSADRLVDFNYRLLVSYLDIWIRRLAGDLGGAAEGVQALHSVAGSSPSSNAGLLALLEADLAMARGRARAAVPLLREAALRLDEADFGGLSSSARYRLAQALSLVGDPVSAKAELELGSATEDRILDIFRPEQLLAQAWARAATGDKERSAALLAEAGRVATDQGQLLVEVHVLHARTRLGDRSALRRQAQVAERVEGTFANAAALQARSLLARDVEGMARAGQCFESFGALGEAADAFAQGSRLATRAGAVDDAGRFAHQAVAIAEACGIVGSPALRPVLSRNGLTRRQREIAIMAAQGLTNRVIAQQLGIGVRTVESHLAATYQILGVSSRSRLADALPIASRQASVGVA